MYAACDGLPKGAAILNTLHVVEYLDPDDDAVYKMDLSCGGNGKDMDLGKQLEMIEWARAFALSDLLADMVHERIFGDGDEEIPA